MELILIFLFLNQSKKLNKNVLKRLLNCDGFFFLYFVKRFFYIKFCCVLSVGWFAEVW